ncbi:MAG: hypothetical protein V4544_00955 [Pseudomonadota bacterium]
MKKNIYVVLVLLSILLLNASTILAGDQIVISADGNIQKTTEAPAKKTVKEVAQSSNTKKNKKKSPKSKTTPQKSTTKIVPTLPISNAEPQMVKPTAIKTPDIILAPDMQGKTFRLHIKTKLSPAFAIIAANNGFFLIMDKKYSFQLPDLTQNISFIKDITAIDDPKVLIFRFTLEPHIYTNLENKEKNIYLNFFYQDVASTFVQTPTPALLSLEEKQWPNIIMKPLVSGGSEAFVMLDNDTYYVYMTTKPDGGYQHLYQTPYFKTVLTQQGFAVQNLSNKTQFVLKDNQLHISHPITAVALAPPTNARHYQNIFDVHPKRNLTQERLGLMNEKNELNPPYTLEKQLQWAWISIALNLGQDAKIYLKTAAIQYPKAVYHPLYKALLGMAHFLNQEYKDALNCWQTLPNTLEIAVWKQLAASALGQCKGINQLIFNIGPILEHYPTSLHEVLIQHSLKIAESLHNFSAVYLLLGAEKNDNSLSLKWIKDLYQAKTLYEKKEFKSSNKLLKEMHLENYPDKTPMELLVETEFLNVLNNLKLKEQSLKEAIQKLYDLRFKWRGGSLEYRISQKLVHLLEIEKRYSDSLAQLSELKRLFPNRSGVELIDFNIKHFYTKYFQNINGLSPLKIIKTYGEYLEFIPEGKAGDDIIKVVVEQYEKIDLLDEAAELLSRNLENKHDSPEKIEVIFKIIDIHMHNQKYDAALAVINTFPQEIATIEQKSKLIIRQAHALLGDKKTAEALTLLNASTAREHGILAAKIYAQNKKWHDAAEKLSSTQYLIDAKKNPKQLITLLNDLAIMYSMDNQIKKLRELGSTYKELMKDQKSFQFFTRSTNNQLRQRDEAEMALADITNISSYIKRELERPGEKLPKKGMIEKDTKNADTPAPATKG